MKRTFEDDLIEILREAPYDWELSPNGQLRARNTRYCPLTAAGHHKGLLPNHEGALGYAKAAEALGYTNNEMRVVLEAADNSITRLRSWVQTSKAFLGDPFEKSTRERYKKDIEFCKKAIELRRRLIAELIDKEDS